MAARLGNLNKQNVLKTVGIIFITLSIFYIVFTKIDFYSVVEVLLHANVFYLFISGKAQYIVNLFNKPSKCHIQVV